ncbi:hypothetical protein [Actinoplanes couchii]|uniref:AG2 protein n=1 Tax=Actinoplanes couchii TaxID=403638 RepID=A0ABQ3XEF1_9ACTN|nr:hypothetical protein [Actinoplanes couchii]MDR6319756.1 hypothetical protein [Actinoplanes couchii]GID56890.1 hypothetical protein Aco03nite_052940 [Actinoplanes couchii]
MSELTLQDLLSWQAGPWQSAANGWRRVADKLEEADEDFVRGTRDLPEAWSKGTGSQAAATRATALKTRVSDAYTPVKSIGDQLDLHGYAMAGLRQQAEQIITTARNSGFEVDVAKGVISEPEREFVGPRFVVPGRTPEALAAELTGVLTRARSQDDETAAILNANVPSGPGRAWGGQAGAIDRAEELALKLKNPSYQPSPEELEELRLLLDRYGDDEVFAHDFLTTLGPKGLLELNGTLATYQLDRPGVDADSMLFDSRTADAVKGLQSGLGDMLETATDRTGKHRLPDQWVDDLKEAGRSKFNIGDPDNPARYVEGVYGYQLLGPLLHDGEHDPKFVADIGGDMVDFEMSQGKNSALWTEARSENVRLDWTRNHDDNKAPAGYDPITALMDGMSHNGAGTQDLLLGRTGEGAESNRLPRLDYLLTDRNWDAASDVPGGPGWMAELMENGESYRNVGLDRFGEALERATIDHPGEESRRLIESIIFETNVDEEAQGAANGEKPEEGKTTDFTNTNLVEPQLRDSMGNIMAAYIGDVNENIALNQPVTRGSFQVAQDDLTRFLADLGKDEKAHEAIGKAESLYTAAMYDQILAGQVDPGNTLRGDLDAMKVVSHNHGSVMGVIDHGAGLAQHQTSADLDQKINASIEDKYKILGPVSEAVSSVATDRVPGASDLVNGVVGEMLSQMEESEKVDGTGRTNFEVGEMLNAGRTATVGLTESALYHSGRLDDMPAKLYVDGKLTPMNELSEDQRWEWQYYVGHQGMDTVGRSAVDAASSYQDGLAWADQLLGKAKEGGS